MDRRAAYVPRHRRPALGLFPGRLRSAAWGRDVGLKGRAVDHLDDLAHATGIILNTLNRIHRTRHGLRAGLGHGARASSR